MNWLSVFRGATAMEVWSLWFFGEVSKRDVTQVCIVSKTDIMQVEIHKNYGTTFPQVNVRNKRGITVTWIYAMVHFYRLNGQVDVRVMTRGTNKNSLWRPTSAWRMKESNSSCLWHLVQGDWMNPAIIARYSDKRTSHVHLTKFDRFATKWCHKSSTSHRFFIEDIFVHNNFEWILPWVRDIRTSVQGACPTNDVGNRWVETWITCWSWCED